jgi:hypothetical protein
VIGTFEIGKDIIQLFLGQAEVRVLSVFPTDTKHFHGYSFDLSPADIAPNQGKSTKPFDAWLALAPACWITSPGEEPLPVSPDEGKRHAPTPSRGCQTQRLSETGASPIPSHAVGYWQ